MNVRNKNCIRNISRKSMAAAHTRNRIAILAIALTTILFTALFTIVMSINQSFQYNNFRQAGGIMHGNLKNITEEQYEELKTDSIIKEYGCRRFVGMPKKQPFHKAHVEISFCNENTAKWMFMEPKEGRLPKEGTKEAATDLRVLSLLGIEPKIGTEFTITFDVDGEETTQSFILCGWWDYDSRCVASHVLISESYAEEIFQELDTQGKDGMTGKWSLDIMLKSSLHIQEDLLKILEKHGYQSDSVQEENYIGIGVNWGYVGAQLSSNLDLFSIISLITLLGIIIFTGYLIIYNVFQISVTNDIRFYGLLKTIGTTGRQIRKILYGQAMLLSAIGIPIGLLIGYGLGSQLVPFVISKINPKEQGMSIISIHPMIFIGAALFSLFTVWISCMRPGKIAAKVSPIEAVRYTEGSYHKTVKSGEGNTSLTKMAWANLGRSRGKTVVTILSLTFAVVLLNLMVTFTNGFDMDKYLSRMAADFIIAEASYFQTSGFFEKGKEVPEEVIELVEKQGEITEGGRIYGITSVIQEYVTEDYFRKSKWWYEKEQLDELVERTEKDAEGRLLDQINLYGMERYPLERLTVVEGDLSKLYTPGNYIAAVYEDDDYGKLIEDSHWAKVGDKITLCYVEEWEYFNPDTGEIYPNPEEIGDSHYEIRRKNYREIEYEVAAIVVIPSSLSYRYFGSDAFILNAETFCQDTKSNSIMQYCFDTTEESNQAMEEFLTTYTQQVNSQFDFESKQTYVESFKGLQGMFSLLGGIMCFIIGVVGILNFLNAVLTGMITRKREFAVLQSIGMTGRQLKTMLIWEGVYYAMGSIGLAAMMSILLVPVISSVLSSAFWFFTYRFTILPILVVAPFFALFGVVLPLITYRKIAVASIVERLREVE